MHRFPKSQFYLRTSPALSPEMAGRCGVPCLAGRQALRGTPQQREKPRLAYSAEAAASAAKAG